MRKNLFAYILLVASLVSGFASYTLAQVSPGVGFFKLTGTTVHPTNVLGWNVGVSTTTASVTLAVHGDFYASGSSTIPHLRIASSTATNCDLKADTNGVVFCGTDTAGSSLDAAQLAKWATSTANVDAIYTANATRIGVASTTPQAALSVQGDALVAGTTTVKALVATSSLAVGGTTGSLLIVQSNGNVGIGIETPDAILRIDESANANADLVIGVPSTNTYDPNLALWVQTETVWDMSIDTSDSNKFKIANGASYNNNAAGTKLTIETDGDVGIGIESPLARVHITGGTTIFDNPSAAIRVLETAGTLGNNDLGVWLFGTNTFALADFSTGRKGILINTTSGNVGVGSTTPYATLAVQGDLIAASSTFNGVRATSTIRLRDEEVQSWSGTGLSITGGVLNVPAGTCITANANDIAVTTNCTDAATVDGFEGAGFLRSNASDEFETGNTLTVTGTLDSNGAVSFADTTVIWDGATTDFTFTGDFTANTNQLTLLKSSGFLGVATVTPRALLSIQGNALIAGTTTINAGVVATGTAYFSNVVTTASSTMIGLTVSSQGLKVSNLTSCTSELETDSAGNIFCGTSSAGAPGGSDTQIQFNDASAFAGAVGLVWDKTNLFLGVGSTTPRQVLSVQGNALISGTSTAGTVTATSTLTLNFGILPDGSLRIPVGANPTVTTEGRIALDTTDYQLLIATGTAPAAVPVVYARDVKRLYSFTVGTSSAAALIDTSTIGLPTERDGYRIYYARCWTWGGTSVVISTVGDDAGVSNTVTCTTASTTDQAFVLNNTFTAGEGVDGRIGAVTGSVYKLGIAFYGVITRE